ncbi:MAG: TIGR02588 family protein, partial [Prochlorotrichaceae cyanobacterium]
MLDPSSPQTRSSLKWLTFGVASLFLAILIGLVIYADFLNQDRPPILTVEIVEPFRAVEEQFYVPFTVANEGGESA